MSSTWTHDMLWSTCPCRAKQGKLSTKYSPTSNWRQVMLRGANIQAKSLLLLVMFEHWRAVRSRGLAENVLCHICCAPVLTYNGNFREFSDVPLPFLFPLLSSRKSPGRKLCHFLQNCKEIYDQHSSKVRQVGFWSRTVRSWMKGSQRRFHPFGLFYSVWFYIPGSLHKAYVSNIYFLLFLPKV